MKFYPPIPDTHELKATLHHDHLMDFIKPWLQKKNRYTRTYHYTLGLGLLIIGMMAGMMLARWSFDPKVLSHISFGVLASFLIIPFHELLHGLAYKLKGAKKIEYKAYWKKMVFYAIADKFSIGYDAFRFVALLPFVLVTVSCLFCMLVFNEWWIFFFAMAYSHAAFCGGDFGLLSYMYENKNAVVLTVDDIEKNETYFYHHK